MDREDKLFQYISEKLKDVEILKITGKSSFYVECIDCYKIKILNKKHNHIATVSKDECFGFFNSSLRDKEKIKFILSILIDIAINEGVSYIFENLGMDESSIDELIYPLLKITFRKLLEKLKKIYKDFNQIKKLNRFEATTGIKIKEIKQDSIIFEKDGKCIEVNEKSFL